MNAEISIECGFYVVRVFNSAGSLRWTRYFATKAEETAYGVTLGMPRLYFV